MKVSIIMPSYNSERVIEKALKSIRSQLYDQNKLEILVCDGGSVDDTRKIALDFGAKILENPDVQPECAKYVGLNAATGDICVFLDTDEEFSSPNAIALRTKFFMDNPDQSVLFSGGYSIPDGCSSINEYILYFSDPFTYFMYRISSSHQLYLCDLKKKYAQISSDNYATTFGLNNNSIIPLADLSAGNTVRNFSLKNKYTDEYKSKAIVPYLTALIVKDQGAFSVLKDDHIVHNSSDSAKRYINKLRWRVVGNLSYSKEAAMGFSNRVLHQPLKFRVKKYGFPLYAYSLIFPLVDSFVLVFKTRKLILFAHPLLSIYVANMIIFEVLKKAMSIQSNLKSYGEK